MENKEEKITVVAKDTQEAFNMTMRKFSRQINADAKDLEKFSEKLIATIWPNLEPFTKLAKNVSEQLNGLGILEAMAMAQKEYEQLIKQFERFKEPETISYIPPTTRQTNHLDENTINLIAKRSAEELKKIILAKQPTETTANKNSPETDWRFDLYSGKIMKGEVVKHSFQKKNPDCPSSIGKLSLAGQLFVLLWGSHAIINKNTKLQLQAGESKLIQELANQLKTASEKTMRETINSVKRMIKDKKLPMRLSEDEQNGHPAIQLIVEE